MYVAEAAAVRMPESAGLGPEGGPGSQGGAYTGDFTYSNCFFVIFFSTRQYVHIHPCSSHDDLWYNPDQAGQVTGKRARQRRGCVIVDYQ